MLRQAKRRNSVPRKSSPLASSSQAATLSPCGSNRASLSIGHQDAGANCDDEGAQYQEMHGCSSSQTQASPEGQETVNCIELTYADLTRLEKAEPFVCIYNFSPTAADELEFVAWQYIRVIEKSDDGWFLGMLAHLPLPSKEAPVKLRVGQDIGWLPSNYVRRITRRRLSEALCFIDQAKDDNDMAAMGVYQPKDRRITSISLDPSEVDGVFKAESESERVKTNLPSSKSADDINSGASEDVAEQQQEHSPDAADSASQHNGSAGGVPQPCEPSLKGPQDASRADVDQAFSSDENGLASSSKPDSSDSLLSQEAEQALDDVIALLDAAASEGGMSCESADTTSPASSVADCDEEPGSVLVREEQAGVVERIASAGSLSERIAVAANISEDDSDCEEDEEKAEAESGEEAEAEEETEAEAEAVESHDEELSAEQASDFPCDGSDSKEVQHTSSASHERTASDDAHCIVAQDQGEPPIKTMAAIEGKQQSHKSTAADDSHQAAHINPSSQSVPLSTDSGKRRPSVLSSTPAFERAASIRASRRERALSPRSLIDWNTAPLCRAMFDCDADDDDELAFKEGDIIVLVQNEADNEWWEGAHVNKLDDTGLLPREYVEMISDELERQRLLKKHNVIQSKNSTGASPPTSSQSGMISVEDSSKPPLLSGKPDNAPVAEPHPEKHMKRSPASHRKKPARPAPPPPAGVEPLRAPMPSKKQFVVQMANLAVAVQAKEQFPGQAANTSPAVRAAKNLVARARPSGPANTKPPQQQQRKVVEDNQHMPPPLPRRVSSLRHRSKKRRIPAHALFAGAPAPPPSGSNRQRSPRKAAPKPGVVKSNFSPSHDIEPTPDTTFPWLHLRANETVSVLARDDTPEHVLFGRVSGRAQLGFFPRECVELQQKRKRPVKLSVEEASALLSGNNGRGSPSPTRRHRDSTSSIGEVFAS